MNNVSSGNGCCLLTAGDHQWTAIEKLISFTQWLQRRKYASVSEHNKSENRAFSVTARREVSLRTEKMLSMFCLRNKNVPRPERTDVVPGWNSTRNGSGTISTPNHPIFDILYPQGGWREKLQIW